jgi:hypothetical protein
MRILVLTVPGDDKLTTLPAIESTLDFLGMPYDVLDVTQLAGGLTADKLADGCNGLYQAVLLTNGELAYSNAGSWTSALDATQWQTLWDYEVTFGVRQVSWYTYPTAAYGFQAPSAVDTTNSPLAAKFTFAGKSAFPYMNTSNAVVISNAWTYLAKPLDSSTKPWLTDNSGNALVAMRTYPDGRENLSMTFDSNQYLTHNTVLGQGIISWATRGVFLGERHVYISAQIDDVLLDDDVWTPDMVCGTDPETSATTYRITDKDMSALKSWQSRIQNKSTSRDVTLDMAFNGYGATDDADYPTALTKWIQNYESAFKWISHTWDHELLDGPAATYDMAYAELKQNIDIANARPRNSKHDLGGLDLRNFSRANLVTPEISGLNNAAFLKAASDLGIKYLVSDTSKQYPNPSPNAGVYNPLQPDILMIPRIPTNLFYNVSTPDQWVAEFNCFYGPNGSSKYFDHNLSYNEILDFESDKLVGYMLSGNNDPWMFHQPNLRAYDGKHSLLSDLLDRTLAKYNATYNLPILSPTMDDLGQTVASRMQYNAAGVSATIKPGKSITLTAQHDVTVPITGVGGWSAESYGGQRISYVRVRAGQTVTISLR